MTYINIALRPNQSGDQPRAAKQKRIRCKASIRQTQLFIGHEQQSESVYGAAAYHHHKSIYDAAVYQRRVEPRPGGRSAALQSRSIYGAAVYQHCVEHQRKGQRGSLLEQPRLNSDQKAERKKTK